MGIARFDEEVRRAASGVQKTADTNNNNCDGAIHSAMEQVNEVNYGSSCKNYQEMTILMNQRRLNSVMATDQDYQRGSEVLEIPHSNKNRLPTSYYSKARGGGHADTMRSGGSTQKDSSQFLATSAMYD